MPPEVAHDPTPQRLEHHRVRDHVGEAGQGEEVEVLASHWEPFFTTQAGRHGWTEESLRTDWEAQK